MTTSELEKDRRVDRKTYQNIGLILGPIVFITMISNAGSQSLMPIVAWKVASVGLLMAIWWATEAIPLPATALLPLALFPLLGVFGEGVLAKDAFQEAALPYAHSKYFLISWRVCSCFSNRKGKST